MLKADVIAFATPVYFYEMSGQMKTMLDRTNPLFPSDYAFRDIYLLATAADDQTDSMDGAIKGLEGWIRCFEKTRLKGVLRGLGIDGLGAAAKARELVESAYVMGKNA